MLNRLNNYLPKIANCIATTKQSVSVMLFFAYIWDSTRKSYIDSRRTEFEEHYKQQSDQLDKDQFDVEFKIPIRPMPRLFRIYQVFSTSFVVVATIKYMILCTIYYRWLDVDKVYACYIPGRLGLLADEGLAYELPWLGLTIFFYHIIWRCIWLYTDPFEIEVLLFLCYDKDTVLDKQYEIIDLNDSHISTPDVAYRNYLCNRLFYRRLFDSQGRAVYVMKRHRTVEFRELMEDLSVKLRLINYTFLTISTVTGLSALYTYLRHDYFDMSYPSCRTFSDSANTANFEWSFSDKFRLCYLFFDLLDGGILLVDTTMGLTVPLSIAIALTHDLCLRFAALRRRINHLSDRFRSSLTIDCDLGMEIGMLSITHPTLVSMDSRLLVESDEIFDETIDTFEQVKNVDEYVRRLSTFTVFVWLILTASFQAFSTLDLVPKGTFISFFNTSLMVFVYTALIIIFMILARPHHQAQLLYKQLCIVMAVCPAMPKAKIAWRWLLEYYSDTNQNSLHIMGRSYALSNLNTLRCASWFVTCTVIIFSLLKH